MRFHEFAEFCDGRAAVHDTPSGEPPTADDLAAREAFHRANGTPIATDAP